MEFDKSQLRSVAMGLLFLSITVVCCVRTVASAITSDVLQQTREEAWYQEQVRQDCVPPPYDDPSLAAVKRAHAGERGQFVHGLLDSYRRKAKLINNLKSRRNPKGEGVIVTAWRDSQRGNTADYSRSRSVWRVLAGRVYPVNRTAASDLGRLSDGMPASIQKRAGLVHSYKRGQTMMDQLGLEEETFVRRFSGGNPFPDCR